MNKVEIIQQKCCACGKEHTGTKTQWWRLSGYYGLNGFVCAGCFEKVAHRDGKPNHPVAYRNILKKLASSNAKLAGCAIMERKVELGTN